MRSKITLLWLSAAGSTILALCTISAMGYVLYAFLLKNRNYHMGFHFNESWLAWILPVIIWLLFPVIYLWLKRHQSRLNKNKLFIYGAFSNTALFITLPLLVIIISFLNEI